MPGRRMQLMAALLASCSLAACGFGNDVEQSGNYVFVPPTPVTDSAPYPLASLLYVQRDVGRGETRLYLFRGELRKADLGLEDLRRIAASHGGFQMSFDNPQPSFDSSEPIDSAGTRIPARVGGRALPLSKLDNDTLYSTQTSRWLANVATSDYDVSAYFGVMAGSPPERIEVSRFGIDYTPRDFIPSLATKLDEEAETFSLEYVSDADYVVIELVQPITEKPEEADDKTGDGEEPEAKPRKLDALVRTSLAPGTAYVVSKPLMTDVTGQGCWSREKPLEARLHQVARRYQPHKGGDWAIVYERIDSRVVDVAQWTALLGEPKPQTYCEDYQ